MLHINVQSEVELTRDVMAMHLVYTFVLSEQHYIYISSALLNH